MQEKKLSDLVPGDVGVVLRLHDSVITPRLTEMGLFKGKKVTVLFQAPFNGPIAVDVDGYVLSLRTEEADMVVVSNFFSEN
jgi:ferrous iron transport protein B